MLQRIGRRGFFWALTSLLLSCPAIRIAVAQTDRLVSSQASATIAPRSTFFSTAAEESYSTYQIPGDGDLWPTCWADDGKLYAANGDGAAFTNGTTRYDMAVSAIGGLPPHLSGKTIATDIGANWSGQGYNRKPTGMLCIHGDIYLAFQNLNDKNFSDAPAASIAKSTNHGATWTWKKDFPMFGTPGNPRNPRAYKFTTIFFLDYGRDSSHAIDDYAYAYGLDYSWRGRSVMYLARVRNTEIMNRSAWQFYAGADKSGEPRWTLDIIQKKPVLTDNRLLYPITVGRGCPPNQHVIGQGGVTYDASLKRYIFASWSCATHEFYEAPAPWGPWSRFLSHDFGSLRLPHNRGMYGTSIPSKFISADGTLLYVQSNVCCGGDSYTFSLRKLYLRPYHSMAPLNGFSSENLATLPGVRAISKSTHFGLLCGPDCSNLLVSGPAKRSLDDFDGDAKTTDWWGYVWPRPQNFDHVVYETGDILPDGGWYKSNLHVQVRRDFQWIDVGGLRIQPAYPYNNLVRAHTVYTLNFHDTCGDGIRIIGTPGGSSRYTSIAQLAVYYGGGNRVAARTPECNSAPLRGRQQPRDQSSSNHAGH